MNLWGLPGSRMALSRRKQNDLLNGRFVHDVDPCVLMKGHEGDHVLSTMYRQDVKCPHGWTDWDDCPDCRH